MQNIAKLLRKFYFWLGSRTDRQIIGVAVLSHIVHGFTGNQDFSWDFLNYHYYNPHAFLTGRVGFDIAPGQIQTYLNPLLDIPGYLMAQFLPAVMVGMVISAVHSLNFVVLFILAKKYLLRSVADPLRTCLCMLIPLWGIMGPVERSVAGSHFHDNIISLLLLTCLLPLLADLMAKEKNKKFVQVTVAGLIFGAACGLKLTAIPLSVAITLSYLLISRNWLKTLVMGFGGIVGCLLTYGPWAYVMIKNYNSPMFPYFNKIFKSEYFPDFNIRYPYFIPKSTFDYFMRPFHLIYTGEIQQVGCERLIFDARFILTFGLLGLMMLVWFKYKPLRDKLSRLDCFFIVLFVSGWFLWLEAFAVHRYVLMLEMLVPLILFRFYCLLVQDEKWRYWLYFATAVLCVVTVSVPNWGHRHWGKEYIGAQVPEIPEPENALVMMTGTSATSFLIPFFDPRVRFVRTSSNFHEPGLDYGLQKLIEKAIFSHQGPIYVLYRGPKEPAAMRDAEYYGLDVVWERCEKIIMRMMPRVKLCPTKKISDFDQNTVAVGG